jgi:hypothetical protein
MLVLQDQQLCPIFMIYSLVRIQRNGNLPMSIFSFYHKVKKARVSIGITDIVMCEETSVEELLLNFDMPICRVAYDFSYNIWISAQCIHTLYTRRQNIPKYLKVKTTFLEILNKHKKENRDNEKHDARLYKRFAERVKKYQDRGYGVNWIETDNIIPWIINRFHYGEWVLQ